MRAVCLYYYLVLAKIIFKIEIFYLKLYYLKINNLLLISKKTLLTLDN